MAVMDNQVLLHWTLRYDARPWLINSERAGGERGTGGHYGRAALVKEWRKAFCQLATLQRIPLLAWADIEVTQMCHDNRLPDTANCLPAAKAAIDGIVDAGVLPNDKPAYVHWIHFAPPRNAGCDALEVKISGPLADTSQPAGRPKASGTSRRLPGKSPGVGSASVVHTRLAGVRNRQRRT